MWLHLLTPARIVPGLPLYRIVLYRDCPSTGQLPAPCMVSCQGLAQWVFPSLPQSLPPLLFLLLLFLLLLFLPPSLLHLLLIPSLVLLIPLFLALCLTYSLLSISFHPISFHPVISLSSKWPYLDFWLSWQCLPSMAAILTCQ